MLNFEFYNPTRIVFGQNKVAELARLVPQDARVLVLYGGGSARSTGTLAEVLAALGERTVFEFGGIEPNPSYEGSMPFRVELDNIKDTGVPNHQPAASPVATG